MRHYLNQGDYYVCGPILFLFLFAMVDMCAV